MEAEQDAVAELVESKQDACGWFLVGGVFLVFMDSASLYMCHYLGYGDQPLGPPGCTAGLIAVFIVCWKARDRTVRFCTIGLIAYGLSQIYIAIVAPVLLVVFAIMKVPIILGLIRCIRAVVIAERRVVAGAGAAVLPEARVRRG